MSEARTAVLHRKTKETDIEIELNLDGEGSYGIETGIAFLDNCQFDNSKFVNDRIGIYGYRRSHDFRYWIFSKL